MIGDSVGLSLVGDSRSVFVTASGSDNAFKIELCDTLTHYSLFAGCLTGPGGVADAGCA